MEKSVFWIKKNRMGIKIMNGNIVNNMIHIITFCVSIYL